MRMDAGVEALRLAFLAVRVLDTRARTVGVDHTHLHTWPGNTKRRRLRGSRPGS